METHSLGHPPQPGYGIHTRSNWWGISFSNVQHPFHQADGTDGVGGPDSAWIQPPGMIESSVASLKFILWSLFVYILASPLLLIAFFIPPLGLVLQILLGGHLLGREYAQLVELRIPREHRLRRAGSLSHGAFASFLWLFPFINLIAPLLLACSLVHARLSKDTGNLTK